MLNIPSLIFVNPEHSPTNLPRLLREALVNNGAPALEVNIPLETLSQLIADALLEPRPNGELHKLQGSMRKALSAWDRQDLKTPWTKMTPPCDLERRRRILEILGIPEQFFERWNRFYRVAKASDGTFWDVVAEAIESKTGDFAKEYFAEIDHIVYTIRSARAEKNGLEPVKGLITGHVQSGKTQNMIAVVGKTLGIDFDLVVVLGGTKELLRYQTQQRFDKDLVGSSKIVGEYGPQDGFPDKFVTQSREIQRFTTSRLDLAEHHVPDNQPGSLEFAALRERPGLIVTLKNAHRVTAIENLLRTLDQNTSVLIIDDECDEASVGGTSPTELEGAILACLKVHPNSTYIGYSATPYANIYQFAKKLEGLQDGEATLYPEDFAISLMPSPAYRGYKEFFGVNDDGTVDSDQCEKYVRCYESDHDYLTDAIASWLVAGALKLRRNDASSDNPIHKHHTLLINSSGFQSEQDKVKESLYENWSAFLGLMPNTAESKKLESRWFLGADFDWVNNMPPLSIEKLKVAYEDLCQSSTDRPDFDELRAHLNRTIKATYFKTKLSFGTDDKEHESPILVVNSDDENPSWWRWDNRTHADIHNTGNFKSTDFQFCKMLIGGNMLSRGFTVEGLSTVVLARRSPAVSTLLQMCRWFGFPIGRLDLTRVFLGPTEIEDDGKIVELLTARELLARFQLFSKKDATVRRHIEEHSDEWSDHAPLDTILEIVRSFLDDENDPELKNAGKGTLKLAGSIVALAQVVKPGEFVRPYRPTSDPTKARANLDLLTDFFDGKKLWRVKSQVRWVKRKVLTTQATTWLVGDAQLDDISTFIESYASDSAILRDAKLLLNALRPSTDVTYKAVVLTLEEDEANLSQRIGDQDLYISKTSTARGLSGPQQASMRGATLANGGGLLDTAADELHRLPDFGDDSKKLVILTFTVQKTSKSGLTIVTPQIFVSKGFKDGVKIR
jgi:hypothetical protein